MVNTSQIPAGKVGTGVGDRMWNKIKGNTRGNFELCIYKSCLELLRGRELRQVSSVPWHFNWMVSAHSVCTIFYTPLLPKSLPSAPESPRQYRVQLALIRLLSLIQSLELPKSHLERSENPLSSHWMAWEDWEVVHAHDSEKDMRTTLGILLSLSPEHHHSGQSPSPTSGLALLLLPMMTSW